MSFFVGCRYPVGALNVLCFEARQHHTSKLILRIYDRIDFLSTQHALLSQRSMNKLQIINEGSLKQAVMLGRFGRA